MEESGRSRRTTLWTAARSQLTEPGVQLVDGLRGIAPDRHPSGLLALDPNTKNI